MITSSPSLTLPADYPLPGDRNRYRMTLDAIVAGTANDPQIIQTLDPPRPSDWSPGALRVVTTLKDDHTWTTGIIFGGYVACLLDLYGGLVMLTVLPDRARFLTTHLDVSFLRPTVPGRTRIDATVLEVSAEQAVTEVLLTQRGRVTARGLATQAITVQDTPTKKKPTAHRLPAQH